jgi:hypothetical protein
MAFTVDVESRNLQARPFTIAGEKRHENNHLGACALAALSAETATAGPCTAEIDNVTKLLASKDAGAGPTAGGASATTGQHPPSATMGAADPSTAASSAAAQSGQPQHPPTATMNQAVQGNSSLAQTGGGAREQHPPTATTSQATQGGAASPQDLQSQSRGGPTAAQQAQGPRRPVSDNLASIQAALSEARSFDQSGKESEGMDAIARAKRLAG